MCQSSEYQTVHDAYWRNQRPKRGPPTPAVSAANTPQEGSVAGAASGAAAKGSAQRSTMLQRFTLETTPALQVTAGSQGVDMSDHNALEQWCKKPVTNNLQVFNLIRAYHDPPRVLHPRFLAGGRTPQR